MPNQKVKASDTGFFTRKKMITYSLVTIVFIIFIVLVSKFILDINFGDMFSSLSESYQKNNNFFLWVFLLLLFPLYNVCFNFIIYWYKLKKRNIIVEWYNWFIFIGTSFFIKAITPFALGSEPYAIYWLTKRGLSAKEATAIVSSFTIVCPFIQILITWPSFFWLCSFYGVQAANANSKWILCFWLTFAGLLVDITVTVFVSFMSFSKNFHYFFNLAINKVKKVFKLKFKTKEEIKEEYIINQSFKKIFINEIKDYKFMIFLVVLNIFWNFFYYSSMFYAMKLVIGAEAGLSFIDVFNYVNVGVTANNFIPIPGAEGTLQSLLQTFISTSPNVTTSLGDAHVVANMTFIFRFFSFYICSLYGLFNFLGLIAKELTKKIQLRKHELKNRKTFIFIVTLPNVANQPLTFFESFASKYVRFYNIKIYVINANEQTKEALKEMGMENMVDYLGTTKDNAITNIQSILKLHENLENALVSFVNPYAYFNNEIITTLRRSQRCYDIYLFNYLKIKKEGSILNPYVRPIVDIWHKWITLNHTKHYKSIKLCNALFEIKTLANVDLNQINEQHFIDSILLNSHNMRYENKILCATTQNHFYLDE